MHWKYFLYTAEKFTAVCIYVYKTEVEYSQQYRFETVHYPHNLSEKDLRRCVEFRFSYLC